MGEAGYWGASGLLSFSLASTTDMAEQIWSYLDERRVALQSHIEAMADSRGR